MKIKINKSANYIGLIVIILAFALLYFTYFFVYIPNQEQKLQQRAFRILKEYGNNMFGKNNYYQNHFKNYGLYYKISLFDKNNQIVQKPWLNTRNKILLQDVNDVVDGLLPYVQLETARNGSDTVFIFSKKENKLFIDYNPQIPDSISTKAISSVKDLFNYRDSTQKLQHDESLLESPVKYKVPIDTLMQGLKFDKLFENIILFDDSQVYYNSKFDLVADITNPKALCDSIENVQGGIWETINIRGEDKHVMILPIDFLGKRFCIAGLILDDDFRYKTRTINSQILIFIAAILLLIFIGMPILKIIYIDEKERLKAMDASGSVISFIFGSGLIVLIVIGIIKHQVADRTILEKRLEQISDTLYSYVNSDINAVKELYVSIIDSSKTQPVLAEKVSDEFNNSNTTFYQLKGDTLDNPFPLNEIILIRPDGIVDKAVTRTPFSEVVPLDLSARKYFTQAVNPATSWSSPTYDINFYIESIKSYNTGEGETSFSFYNTGNDTIPVTAITSAVPTFYNQVLPKDIKYVIINSAGNVLYHSIKSKNLHENFIDECESNPKLLKAIDLRTINTVRISYNEKTWLARIIPINETPLYHITLLDLSQTDNKNARIFLFTFYFLFTSLAFIGLGLLVMRWIIPPESRMKNPIWFLSWLNFQGEKYREYMYLSIIYVAFIFIQSSSILYIKKPFSMLIFQLIFIIYSSFVSLLFLNRKMIDFKKLFSKKYYPENIILLFAILMAIILLVRFYPSNLFIFLPLVFITVFTFYIPRILKYIQKQLVLHERFTSIKISKIKNSYVVYLFTWLISISAIPVVMYYFSIKHQEEQFWQKDQLFSIAQDNLELKKRYPNHTETAWFKRIQGNGIDNLSVKYVNYNAIDSVKYAIGERNFRQADKIYSLLPDPVNYDYGIRENRNDSVFRNEWISDDLSLIYSKGGTNGVVEIKSGNNSHTNLILWLLSIIVSFTLVSIGTWLLLKYIASILLNLYKEKWKDSARSWWETLFEKNDINHILLHSFNGDYFLKKTKGYIAKVAKNKSMEIISALQLIDPKFDSNSSIAHKDLIWINGFDLSIYEIDKHNLLLLKVQEICRKAEGKVIVDLPFDVESIDEFYDDFMDENEIGQKEITDIYLLKKRWKTTFKNFFEFNGYLNHKNENEFVKIDIPVLSVSKVKKKSSEHYEWQIEDNETQFINIWDNLTSHEKIVLYDLADDGLFNRKNKPMIQRLLNKKLIVSKPYPRLFSEEFRKFVNKSLYPYEVKSIEKKLGLKGKWRNIQYLILLILIPLATFILISQGMSIEKIFGIFAGIITVVTGVMRVFDGNMLKSSSS